MDNSTSQTNITDGKNIRCISAQTEAGLISHLIGRLSICHDRHDHIELVTELYDLDILKEKAA